MKTFFEWIAVLRGNSVNINFELYPAKEIGEEYEDYVYSLEKMVEIFNKNPKVNSVSEIIFTTRKDAGDYYYSQLDSIKKFLIKNIKNKNVRYVQLLDHKKKICVYKSVSKILYKFFDVKTLNKLPDFIKNFFPYIRPKFNLEDLEAEEFDINKIWMVMKF